MRSFLAKYIPIFVDMLPISIITKIKFIYLIRKKYVPPTTGFKVEDISFIQGNDRYGHEYWLKNYSGYIRNIMGVVEHGIYFGSHNIVVNHIAEQIGSVITFGKYRCDTIKQNYPHHLIVELGPLIHYAGVDQEYYKELTSLLTPGITLVVFPSHSSECENAIYDAQMFINYILEIQNIYNIQNIVVCMHYVDIDKKFDVAYRNVGFRIVTAGSNHKNFLPRLKSIISIADITLSNALGTHVGYCIYLNKPHVIFKQDMHIKITNKYGSSMANGTNSRCIYSSISEEFFKIFNQNNLFSITQEQRDICEYYWGFSKVKTPEELHKELEKCEQHAQTFHQLSKQK